MVADDHDLMSEPSDTTGYTGYQTPTSGGAAQNIDRLATRGALDEHRTTMLVQIMKLYGGGEGAAPTADVVPAIHQTDGLGNVTPHGMIYGVAVARQSSGSGSVISDPSVNDYFLMHVGDRDTTKFRNSGQPSAPDTFRRGSPSDGVLTHQVLAPAPKQFVRFKPEGGIRIVDSAGGIIETFADKRMTFTPASGGMVMLGGTGSDGGTYAFVQTVSGPSSVVKAKL